MTATDAQVRIIMREREKGRNQEQAAASANLRSRKTAAKYERLEKLPSELQQPRQYRTRCNPFTRDWSIIEKMLEDAPSLEAKTLFEWLCEQHPGCYQAGQLRTFQRHVATWRALNQKQVAILEQVHHPGKLLQTDGVWLTELGVTIQGQPFKHLLIHCVLPYSNWEWGRIAQSESLAALQLGLQSTLIRLGYVPEHHRTDNSSAATYRPGAKAQAGSKREYTDGYLQLLDHYGLKPNGTNISSHCQLFNETLPRLGSRTFQIGIGDRPSAHSPRFDAESWALGQSELGETGQQSMHRSSLPRTMS